MRQVSFSQGDTIIKKGTGGCSLYYLEQGHVNLMDLKKGQQKIEEKNFFGAKYFLGAIRNALNLGQVLSFRLLYTTTPQPSSPLLALSNPPSPTLSRSPLLRSLFLLLWCITLRFCEEC
jgi:hypothetical protein